jgi:catechol 2,3-dioxygenase-like lactoylglutathione lyase family enzyme
MPIKKLGHVGIFAKDLPKMRAFYRDVLGLHVADETENIVFMSSDPDEEHHEFVLVRATTPEQHTSVQQISFSCEKAEDVVDYFNRFKANDVRFARVVSHGNAIGLYFYDPEGNHCEVYWTTPWKARQPYGVAVDLSQPLQDVLRSIEEDVKEFGETGHADPDSFKAQRDQFEKAGMRV